MAKLEKGLGLGAIFCIASGAMISSGLFVLPGLAYAWAGPAVVVSYLLAGLLAVTGLLSAAELSTAMPRAGSDYFYIARGISPGLGTVAGLFNWVSFSLKAAFALVGMAAFIRLFVAIDMRISGTVLGLAFLGLNLVGVKEAARVQIGLVVVLIAMMVFYVVRGVPEVDLQRFADFAPHGAPRVLFTAGFVFVAYGGLLQIASIAEEVKDPGRNIPAGMILSLVVTGMLYALMVWITVGVVPGDRLSGSMTPIADGGLALMGRAGQILFGAVGALAFLTTANAGIMTGSRYLFAMSRDKMLPEPFGRVSGRFSTPYVAISVTGGLVILAVFVDLYILVEAASIGLILANILANLSVIALRESRVQNYRPKFRSPLYPWVQVVGILGFIFLLFEMGVEAFVVSAVLVVAGFCLYWFYGRKRVQKETGLLHLVQRITARELVTGTLEAELKGIIRERDEMPCDRFDRMIESSPVIDVEEPMEAAELFRLVADELSDRLSVDKKELVAALEARERESSTVIGPTLAVPHVVIEKTKAFDILLARSRAGFIFPPDKKGIHAVFVLVGSKDERNFHLQALAAIAQIVQEPGFDEKWLAAREEQSLRDLVVLGERKRNR